MSPDPTIHLFDSGTLKCVWCGADYFAAIRKTILSDCVGPSDQTSMKPSQAAVRDIIARLRNPPLVSYGDGVIPRLYEPQVRADMLEAAAEIERLRGPMEFTGPEGHGDRTWLDGI